MGVLNLFVTASVPVLEVLIVTAVGAFIATDYIGILSEEARKYMNNVVFYVLNPGLVSTNLSKTITWESLSTLWFMPINILLTFVVGSLLGWILIKITKPPSRLRGLILGCCAAGNLGNLLLIIIPATCQEKGSPFGDADVCSTYGLAYASLSMAIAAIYLWSYVYNIVRISSSGIEDTVHPNGLTPTTELPEESATLVQGSFMDGTSSTTISSISVHCADESAPLLSPFKESSEKVPISVKVRRLLSRLSAVTNLRRLFSPSTIAVIVGFIVGVIPQIRHAVIGESAPLRVIQASGALVGQAAIPIITLILGGNLIRGLRGSGIKYSLIAGVVVVRYILLPLLGIVVVKGAVRLGLVHADPLYQFTLLLQYALPPAMNIGTITQLFGAGESECSVIFLWTYAFASVALTLWSMLFMWLVS